MHKTASIVEEHKKPVEHDTESGVTTPKRDGQGAYVEPAEVTDAYALLNLVTVDNPHHPIHWPATKRWSIAVFYALLQVFVTMLSTDYVSAEFLVEERFNVGAQVATLGQSLFIIGTAFGPVFLGPVSDLLGRKWVYVIGISLYAIVNFGVAYPLNMPMLAIFMFLAGTTGSVALCNVAATIGDMFGDADNASQAMALFVASANIGPSIGSPIGEWIADNTNMGFKWIGLINVIIGFAFAIAMCFMPETLPRLVIKRASAGSEDADEVTAVLATARISVAEEIWFSCTMALKLMVFEPIILSLGIYNGLAYGLLFLYLDGVFAVFSLNNGLSYIGADLTYLNFAVGVTIMFIIFVPIQTWLVRRDRVKTAGVVRPEARFLISLVGVWGFPVSLFWFAWTSYGNVTFWSPVIAGTLLGVCDPLLWLGMLSYIVDSYPTCTGSAVAAFLIPSFLIAAALAHAGVAMFDNLTTQVAMSILGGVSVMIVALVYVIYFFGPSLRARSKYARKF